MFLERRPSKEEVARKFQKQLRRDSDSSSSEDSTESEGSSEGEEISVQVNNLVFCF